MNEKYVVSQYTGAINRLFTEKVFITLKELPNDNKRLIVLKNGDYFLIFDYFSKNNRYTVDLGNFSILVKNIDDSMKILFDTAKKKKCLTNDLTVKQALIKAIECGERIF